MADDNGNGNDNDDKGNKGNNKDKLPDLTALNDSLKGLPAKIQTAVQDAVVTALHTVKDESDEERKNREAADKDDDDPGDVETMSNKELTGHILKQVTKAVSELVKPLDSKISGVQSTTEEDRIRTEAVAIAKEDPMFMEMREEMAEVAKSHPDLSVRDIYTLSKVNNPEKVEKLEKETKEKEDKVKKEAGESPEAFGGFLPGSGVKTSTEGDKKMSTKDAANKAFDDVMKDVPAHIISGDIG